MVLALLRCNPLPLKSLSQLPQQQHLHSPCWLNGRPYLHQPHESAHIPICLSFAPITFPNLRQLTLERDATKSSIRQMLLSACATATRGYLQLKQRKNMLPPAINIMETVGENMWKYVLKINPSPPPGLTQNKVNTSVRITLSFD